MIITCPDCQTKYRYDERRFDGAPTKKVKCTSCGHSFEAENPAMERPDIDEDDDLDGIGRPLVGTGFGAAAGEVVLEPVEPATPIPMPEAESPPPDADADVPDVDEPATPVPEPAPVAEGEAAIPPLPTDPRYSLAVIAGGQAGTVFQIHKSRIFLGRGSAMDIQLRDSEVSRRHALLEIRDGQVVLTDLGATNGTWFNATRIESVELDHQDEFTLGSTTLMLIITPVQGAR